MSIARLTVIRLREPPKALLARGGRDAEVVETLQFLAKKYSRPCSLTLEQLEVEIYGLPCMSEMFADFRDCGIGLRREQEHAGEGLQLRRGWYAFKWFVCYSEDGALYESNMVSETKGSLTS